MNYLKRLKTNGVKLINETPVGGATEPEWLLFTPHQRAEY